MNDIDIDTKGNKSPHYNNSNPLLTGDLLFQKRIDSAIVQFNSSLIETGMLSGRLGAVESLFLEMVYFLSDEEAEKVNELIESCHKCFSIICYFRNKVNRTESYKDNLETFLNNSKKAMTILVKKSFQSGHIIKQGENKQNGRR